MDNFGHRYDDDVIKRGRQTERNRVFSVLREPLHHHGPSDTRGEPSYLSRVHQNSRSFSRSFSRPPENFDNFDREEPMSLPIQYSSVDTNINDDPAYLSRNNSYTRSFSHPTERPYKPRHVTNANAAIHDEIMSNPWDSCSSRPRKRNRYAIYFPNDAPFESLGQFYDNDISRHRNQNTATEPRGEPCISNAYHTYRRAPRAYPRLDLVNYVHNPINVETSAASKRQLIDSRYNHFLPKLPNVEVNNAVGLSVENSDQDNRLHQVEEDTQPGIQHLFSIRLNDVKQVNMPRTNGQDDMDARSKTCAGACAAPIKNKICQVVSSSWRNKSDSRKSDSDSAKMKKKKPEQAAGTSAVKRPFFYCRWVTDYPKTLFLITLGGHIMIALLTVMLLLAGYDLFPTDFETLPMYDWQVPWMKRDFAWRFRHEYKQRYVRKWFLQGLDKWYRSMAYGRANIVLYYDTEGNGNVFTKENLKAIETIEHNMFNMHNYTQYCVQTSSLKCQKLTSVLRYFDGTYADIDPVFNDPDYNNISMVLYTARTHNKTKVDFAYFLASDHHVTKKTAFASVTRTIIPMGYPLALEQKPENMENEMERFLVNKFKPTVHRLKDSHNGFKLIYWSYLLFKHDIVIQIFYDLMLAVGSISFIFGFIVYHTKSLFISSFAVSSILTSFLCTNILYRVILDFRYFGFFHVITLFIILGIGADDLFVFLDVWKNTEYKQFDSLGHRLDSAYKKSIKSMFFTSLTTTVAFLASAFSPLLATKSFGVFAGLLVVVNYLSVVLYFPTVVIIHHLYFRTWKWSCLTNLIQTGITCVRGTDSKQEPPAIKPPIATIHVPNNELFFDDNSAIGTNGNAYNVVVGKINPTFKSEEDEYGFLPYPDHNDVTNAHAHNNSSRSINATSTSCTLTSETSSVYSTGTSNVSSSAAMQSKKQKKALVRFFRDFYFYLVTHWILKWVIVIILSSVVLFFCFSVSKLETDNEQAQFYRKSHNYGRALQHDFHGFVANKNDRNVVVYIVWGLEERDMSQCHFSDGRCIGVEKYDKSFNPNTLEAQLAIKNFCDKLHALKDHEIDYFKIRRDFASGHPEIKCFAHDLDRFLKLESDATGENLTLPWTYRKSMSFMESRSLVYNTFKFNTSFSNVFEIPISYWLNDKYRFENKKNFDTFHTLIGEGISPYSSPMKSDFSVFYGNRLVYLGVQVNLTLGVFSSGYVEGKPAMDRWETFVKSEVSKMPPGMQNGFQLTKDYWHALSVQKTIAENAIFGIVAGILLAFPILTIATQNVLIGLFATLSMCCSTICVVGIIPLFGWKLGILESLNMCMVVGLTVDYVVHLAEGYHMSKKLDRKSRVQDMLEIMGISVFSGACTTLGASVFMFFAQIQFIIRFGIFMFCTIGFSLLYSLGMFTTIMGILGPSGDTGDVKMIYRKLRERLRTLFLFSPCRLNWQR